MYSSQQSCLDAASRYLGYRPRSEFEITTLLRRKGFDVSCINEAIAKLKAQRLLDDLAFAQFWTANRESFRPRSRLMLRSELHRKGIAHDTIASVIDGVDEDASAYRAAEKKAARITTTDYDSFRRGLGGFLKRRGFDYEITQRAVDRLWKKRGTNV
ncbi:MAG: regulatory protein RecX [Chloroflexi bacterium]|nr:regulatory protein RecX [Chloroflexota bacterium]